MKNIRKFLSAILALTLVLTSGIIPAMACSLEGAHSYHEPLEEYPYGVWEFRAETVPKDENGNPKLVVVPCEKVATQGYCDIPTVTGLINYYPNNAPGGDCSLLFCDIDNPYYDAEKVAREKTTPVETQPVETEPVTTEAPVETTPAEESEPQLPLADVAVPVYVNEGMLQEMMTYDCVRIAYVADQETVELDGKSTELYSIYPGTRLYKTNVSNYSAFKWYHATLENGVLKAGELAGEYVQEDPLHHNCYFWIDEDEVGKYFIVEVIDEYYTKKVCLHVVEGTLPRSAPVSYAGDVGLSQEHRYTDGGLYAVPAGTVVTLPYQVRSYSGYDDNYCPTDVWSEKLYTSESEAFNAGEFNPVETYLCNGRRCFTVEPGKTYHVNHLIGSLIKESEESIVEIGITESHIFIVADDTAPVIVSEGNNPEANGTAVATPQKVQVDGRTVELQTYALAGPGGMTNYVKLRDLADILDGTAAQFNVTWSKKNGVGIQTKTPYTSRNGTEGVTNYTGNQAYQRGAGTTMVDGVAVNLQCFALQNGAYTYYKLRDLGQALGFNVGWDNANQRIYIESDKPYDPNN